MRVKNYLKDVYASGILENMEKEEEVLKQLSQPLKEELMIEDKGKILTKIPIFRYYFSERFIKRISQYIREVYYSPGDIIDSPDERNIADNSFCFI